MKVVVIVESWGNYKLGDIISEMPESTAAACIANGVIRDFDAPDIKAEEVVPKKETEVKPVKEKTKNA